MSDCIAGLQLYIAVTHFMDVGDTLPFMFSVVNEFSAGCGKGLCCAAKDSPASVCWQH